MFLRSLSPVDPDLVGNSRTSAHLMLLYRQASIALSQARTTVRYTHAIPYALDKWNHRLPHAQHPQRTRIASPRRNGNASSSYEPRPPADMTQRNPAQKFQLHLGRLTPSHHQQLAARVRLHQPAPSPSIAAHTDHKPRSEKVEMSVRKQP